MGARNAQNLGKDRMARPLLANLVTVRNGVCGEEHRLTRRLTVKRTV
jgi:hypothetical protein